MGAKMDLNINHLRSFYVAAMEGSVPKALDRLMVTRPVLTDHLKSLERRVGVRLLVRDGNSIRLTQTGESVFRKASKIFREVREAEQLLDAISSRKGGELRIGCPETLEKCLPPLLIADFEKTCPGVRIVLNNGKDTMMAKSVEDGRNDLAVVRFAPPDCRLNMKAIGEERLVLVAAPSSVHVPGNEIHLRDLAHIPFISMRNGSAVREVVLDFLRKSGVALNITFESSSNALLKEHVRRDNGVAFIEKSAVETELNGCLLKEVRILEGFPRITVAIGYPSRWEISPAAEAFMKLVGTEENTGDHSLPLLRERRETSKEGDGRQYDEYDIKVNER
jgi:DNA-binding transcriptional LysR family regulator